MFEVTFATASKAFVQLFRIKSFVLFEITDGSRDKCIDKNVQLSFDAQLFIYRCQGTQFLSQFTSCGNNVRRHVKHQN